MPGPVSLIEARRRTVAKGLAIVERPRLLVRQPLRERSSLVGGQRAGPRSGSAAPGQHDEDGKQTAHWPRPSGAGTGGIGKISSLHGDNFEQMAESLQGHFRGDGRPPENGLVMIRPSAPTCLHEVW